MYTYRSRVGTDFRGYFGLRGRANVFGRRNVTLVRTLRVRVPNGPFTTYARRIERNIFAR